MTMGDTRGEKSKGRAILEADSITRVPPGSFTRSRNFDDLSPPQTVISRDGICNLHSRQLGFLHSAVKEQAHTSSES